MNEDLRNFELHLKTNSKSRALTLNISKILDSGANYFTDKIFISKTNITGPKGSSPNFGITIS